MNQHIPTILVADDDDHMRCALAARLTQAGFEVVSAADGAQAISILEKRKPDVALLDVEMPGVDGFGVCEYIRNDASLADLPVFFLTGAEDGIIRHNLGALTTTVGGNHYLTKPCDGKMLVMMLRKIIESTCVC